MNMQTIAVPGQLTKTTKVDDGVPGMSVSQALNVLCGSQVPVAAWTIAHAMQAKGDIARGERLARLIEVLCDEAERMPEGPANFRLAGANTDSTSEFGTFWGPRLSMGFKLLEKYPSGLPVGYESADMDVDLGYRKERQGGGAANSEFEKVQTALTGAVKKLKKEKAGFSADQMGAIRLLVKQLVDLSQ